MCWMINRLSRETEAEVPGQMCTSRSYGQGEPSAVLTMQETEFGSGFGWAFRLPGVDLAVLKSARQW